MKPSIDQELEQLEQELRKPLRQALQPPPAPSETAALIEALQSEFNALQAQNALQTLDFNPQVETPSLRRLMWSQFRLNRKSLILAGAAVFLMLIFLVDPKRPFTNIVEGDSVMSLFPVITPLMLVASMLFSYRSWDPGMRAVESITPYPPALVIYCRMLMVVALIIGWALISSVVVDIRVSSAGETNLPFIPFLLQWLGISLLTGGAAMYMLFRKGMKVALVSASLIYILWFIFQNQIFVSSLSPSYRVTIDGVLFVIGAVLVLRSYYRSRSLKVRSAGAGNDHDYH
ncbi:hypothetical protein ACFQ3W_12685 [Paenibacillus puldeungensis]|uniref:Uncharacterized protein n=1 Tax=Paenibacillus puldeungensis TaxID=696536 RepID=A0ABW3RXH9_9BACL